MSSAASLRLGEGDAYNKVLIDRAERRLNSLGFFKKVKITNEAGLRTSDRVIIVVNVEDHADRLAVGLRRLFDGRRLHRRSRGDRDELPRPWSVRPRRA